MNINDKIEINSDNWNDISSVYTVGYIFSETENSINMSLINDNTSESVIRNVPKNQIRIIKL